MTTAHPSPESYAVFNVAGRCAYLGVAVATRTRVARIIGKPALQAVELEHLDTGARRIVECDTVVLTGDWMPDHELARTAGLDMDPHTLGPVVDTALRTSRAGRLRGRQPVASGRHRRHRSARRPPRRAARPRLPRRTTAGELRGAAAGRAPVPVGRARPDATRRSGTAARSTAAVDRRAGAGSPRRRAAGRPGRRRASGRLARLTGSRLPRAVVPAAKRRPRGGPSHHRPAPQRRARAGVPPGAVGALTRTQGVRPSGVLLLVVARRVRTAVGRALPGSYSPSAAGPSVVSDCSVASASSSRRPVCSGF